LTAYRLCRKLLVMETTAARTARLQDMTVAEIARAIRADLKAARKAGGRAGPIADAPEGVQFRVYSRQGTMCDDQVSVQISGHDQAWAWETVEDDPVYGHVTRHTPEMVTLVRAVEDVVAQYNWNRSDSQVDHFDVRFYSSVRAD
jgi:hypothetical protein